MLTAEQKIKWLVLIAARSETEDDEDQEEITEDNVDDLYDELDPNDEGDAKDAVRGGDVSTGIGTPGSAYYESRAVASQLPDGSWVGWTYWYGGGKYGEPRSMDWEPYLLEHRESKQLVTVHEFTKAESSP